VFTETLLDLQKDFFSNGVEQLRPLTLKEVASALNLHESHGKQSYLKQILSCEHGVFGFPLPFQQRTEQRDGECFINISKKHHQENRI